MKSMKSLLLAITGLVAFGAMGSALAQCPTVTSNTANSTPGGGGAWTSQSVGGGGFLDITTTGLAGTNCKLSVNIGATPLANVRSFVSDTSPTDEGRYRARFYFDVSGLTLTLANFQTKIFNAFANTAPGSLNTEPGAVAALPGELVAPSSPHSALGGPAYAGVAPMTAAATMQLAHSSLDIMTCASSAGLSVFRVRTRASGV